MKTMKRRMGCVVLFAAVAMLACQIGARADGAFHVVHDTVVGGEGSWDYAAYDTLHDRLFIARVGGLLALDASTDKPVGGVPSLPGTRIHGVAIATSLGLGMTSDGKDGTATIFDIGSLAVKYKVAIGEPTDAIVYDPHSMRGFAFDGDGQRAIAFDPRTGKVTGTITLPGSPEYPAVDGRGRLFVNLSDRGEVAVIDTTDLKLVAHWPVGGGCKDPTPLAIDTQAARLFIGCRSSVLAVLDATSGRLVETLPIGKGTDAVAFDPSTHLVFVACVDGTMTVIDTRDGNTGHVLQTVPTRPGARTLALDPVRHRVFLPTADLGPMLPKTEELPSRPAVVPETFRILTVSR